MRKVYKSPEIEFDDFEIKDYICADLYGGLGGPEFYSVGDGNGDASYESGIPDAGGEIRPTRPN